jgi:hypothetical protein
VLKLNSLADFYFSATVFFWPKPAWQLFIHLFLAGRSFVDAPMFLHVLEMRGERFGRAITVKSLSLGF